jgi:hypothetical protein
MSVLSKEVQGLLYKVAELETILLVFIGMLDAKGMLVQEELEAIFGAAEIPEILGARIKMIEEQGEELVAARKRYLSEMLGVVPPPEDEVSTSDTPIVKEVLDDEFEETGPIPQGQDPNKKLH